MRAIKELQSGQNPPDYNWLYKPHKNVLKAISGLSSATNLANADFRKWFYETGYTEEDMREEMLCYEKTLKKSVL